MAVEQENQAGSGLVSPEEKQVVVAVRNRRLRRVVIPYLFLLPFLVLFLVFLILPLAYALGISLFENRLVGGTVFVGAENYLRAIGDPDFLGGVVRMLKFGAFQVPIMFGLALLLALVLDSGVVWIRSVFRLGFFLPYAIPSVVAALVWGYLYGPDFGPFAQLAERLGLPAPNFLSDSLVLGSIANIVTWEFTGYNMIILYAALAGRACESSGTPAPWTEPEAGRWRGTSRYP